FGVFERVFVAWSAGQQGRQRLEVLHAIQLRSGTERAATGETPGGRNPQNLAGRMGGRLGPEKRARSHSALTLDRKSRRAARLVSGMGFQGSHPEDHVMVLRAPRLEEHRHAGVFKKADRGIYPCR